MFEGQMANMCGEKFVLVSMGGRAEYHAYTDISVISKPSQREKMPLLLIV